MQCPEHLPGVSLPFVCENGTDEHEINEPIEQLMQYIDDSSNIDRRIPYVMSIDAFKSHFKDDDNDDKDFYNDDDVIHAMVPGLCGLIRKIDKLNTHYSAYTEEEMDLVLSKLSETCKNVPCKARFFIKYEGGEFPPFPKLHAPFLYRINDRMFENESEARTYLTNLKQMLIFERIQQCVVCDIINYIMDNNSDNRLYDTNSVTPNIHKTFFDHLSILNNSNNRNSIFERARLQRNELGEYSILYYNDAGIPMLYD